MARRPRPNQDKYRTCILPCLEEKMRLAGATNLSLSEQAGVSESVINKARHGKPVWVYVAKLIYEALNTRTFKRAKHPMRWTDERWKHGPATKKGTAPRRIAKYA